MNSFNITESNTFLQKSSFVKNFNYFFSNNNNIIKITIINKKVIISMFKLKIKEYRLAKNISQKELGNMSNLSQSYISMLEKGNEREKSPTLQTIESISDALGVCVKDILVFECDLCKNYINKKCKFDSMKKSG